MLKEYNRVFGISIFLILFILIGGVCASDNNLDDNITSSVDSKLDVIELDGGDNLNQDENQILKDEIIYDGKIFDNPDFETIDSNSKSSIPGWNTESYNIKDGKYELEETNPNNFYIEPSFTRTQSSNILLSYEGNTLHIDKPDYDSALVLSKYINFDCIDDISFKFVGQYVLPIANPNMAIKFNILIDDDVVQNVINTEKCDHWSSLTIDTREYSGVHQFKLYFTNDMKNVINLENFTATYNGNVASNFNYDVILNDEIIVQFTNDAIGKIRDIFWDFGDGTNSTEINPVHTFKSGDYTVTLTVANENNTDTYSTVLSLKYPTINGQMYSSVQDAIDNAEDGAVIDIPNDLSENLNINKTVTLNFNGNKLTGSINVNDGAIVTVNNISDVSSVSTDDSSKLTIADSNINSNLELKSGNIDLNSVNFNNCILTITAANTTLVNVNVANGGIVINGGKSKITKSNFTDSTNVITQNDGELELTNNIIKNNNNAINITGGSATISYNAIYNNTGDLTLTGATVTNNWFGTNQVIGFESYLRLVITAPVSEMYPGEEYTITAELVPNTGSLEGSIDNLTLEFTSPNGETTPLTINNNNGEFKFTAGQTTEEVVLKLFNEDYTLVNGENPVSIVTKPLDTNITITSPENGIVVITLTTSEGNASGANVSYTINGGNKVNNVTDANGQIIIRDLTGKVTINATYEGNKTLNPSAAIKAFDFTIVTVITAANVSTTYGAAKELIITLTANGNALANKTINVIVGTINKNLTTNISGQVSVDVSTLAPDTYVATIAFAGDDVYIKSNATANVVVNKVATSLSAPAVSATYNVAKNLVITLTANGKPLDGQKVTVKVGSISKTLTTNSKGQVSLAISSLVPKTYTATISFAGDKIYTASSTNAKVVIAKAKSKITAKKATFKAKKKTKKYTITLKANKKAISKVKVTLKVKGKTYKAKTNAKGVATFKITKLNKKGKYTAKIKFAGNKSYKATSKKIKLTVKK